LRACRGAPACCGIVRMHGSPRSGSPSTATATCAEGAVHDGVAAASGVLSGRAGGVLVLVLVGIAALVWRYRRDEERYRRGRGRFFSGCIGLFETCRVAQDDLAFPVLVGTYRGFDIRLEPIVDHIGFRKLPSLWLAVAVAAPPRYSGAVDVLMRPQGIEFYSPFQDLEFDVPLPPGWPADVVIRSDDPARMPPLEAIAPHRTLFEDPRMKELLITPAGRPARLSGHAGGTNRIRRAPPGRILRGPALAGSGTAPDRFRAERARLRRLMSRGSGMSKPLRRPIHPYWILLIATVLPGFGYVSPASRSAASSCKRLC
jgi:hypothetical protein